MAAAGAGSVLTTRADTWRIRMRSAGSSAEPFGDRDEGLGAGTSRAAFRTVVRVRCASDGVRLRSAELVGAPEPLLR